MLPFKSFLRAGTAIFALITLGAAGCSSDDGDSVDRDTTPVSPITSTTTAITSTTAATTSTTIATSSIPPVALSTEPANADDIVAAGEPWILYQDTTTHEQVSLVRPDGTGRHSPTRDLPGSHQTNPDWSPDGERLTFIVTEVDGTEDLWVADVDGTDAERVVDCQNPCLVIDDPSWSPDGRSIVYSRTIGGSGTSDNTLEVFHPDGADMTMLLGGDPTLFYAGARWSPDSQRLVLEVVQKAGPEADAEITGVTLSVVDLATTPPTVTAITDPALFAATADWSPKGDLIVYSSLPASDDQAPDLFTIHPDGSGLTRITNLAATGGSAAEPTFTPDSTRIVFVAQLTPGRQTNLTPLHPADAGKRAKFRALPAREREHRARTHPPQPPRDTQSRSRNAHAGEVRPGTIGASALRTTSAEHDSARPNRPIRVHAIRRSRTRAAA